MPMPPPLHDKTHTEVRLITVVEMLDQAVRTLRATIEDMTGAKPVDDRGGGPASEPEETS